MVLAVERQRLRRGALEELPQDELVALARLVAAEFTCVPQADLVTGRYGITKGQLQSFIKTAKDTARKGKM
jgi:hypothetical protein